MEMFGCSTKLVPDDNDNNEVNLLHACQFTVDELHVIIQ